MSKHDDNEWAAYRFSKRRLGLGEHLDPEPPHSLGDKLVFAFSIGVLITWALITFFPQLCTGA